jgi:hypothetical protein
MSLSSFCKIARMTSANIEQRTLAVVALGAIALTPSQVYAESEVANSKVVFHLPPGSRGALADTNHRGNPFTMTTSSKFPPKSPQRRQPLSS